MNTLAGSSNKLATKHLKHLKSFFLLPFLKIVKGTLKTFLKAFKLALDTLPWEYFQTF
jgi:hypothetical protein